MSKSQHLGRDYFVENQFVKIPKVNKKSVENHFVKDTFGIIFWIRRARGGRGVVPESVGDEKRTKWWLVFWKTFWASDPP